jgi:hypothetical protein
VQPAPGDVLPDRSAPSLRAVRHSGWPTLRRAVAVRWPTRDLFGRHVVGLVLWRPLVRADVEVPRPAVDLPQRVVRFPAAIRPGAWVAHRLRPMRVHDEDRLRGLIGVRCTKPDTGGMHHRRVPFAQCAKDRFIAAYQLRRKELYVILMPHGR